MECKPIIEGFHTNDKERSCIFLEDVDYLIHSEDEDWLGYGMYFWDNLSNAKYWINKKTKRGVKNEISITKSHIIIDENLDLSDEDIMKTMNELWIEICLKEKKKIESENKKLYYPKNKKIEELTGKKIDYIFEYFEKFKAFKTIKAIGYYPNRKENDFFYKVDLSKGHVTGLAKVIYCVRDSNKVINRKEVYCCE